MRFALATIRIHPDTRRVLRVTCVDASFRHGAAGVRRALGRVFRCVKLKWVRIPVGELIVAGKDGGCNAANALTTRISGIGATGREDTDVCSSRRNDTSGGGGGGASDGCYTCACGAGRGVLRRVFRCTSGFAALTARA